MKTPESLANKVVALIDVGVPRQCLWMMDLGFRERACWWFHRRTNNTRDTIYPASGPQRKNPTCWLSVLDWQMSYRGALMAMVMEIALWCSLARVSVLDHSEAPPSLYIGGWVSGTMEPSRIQVRVSFLGLDLAPHARFLGFGSFSNRQCFLGSAILTWASSWTAPR
jgi:hypothetical protein